MVAPTPSLTLGVTVVGDLPKDVQDIKNAIGTPPPGTTIFDSLQATSKQLGKVDFNDLATNAKTAGTSAQAAEALGTSLTNSIGIPKSGTNIAGTIDAMNATIGAPGTTGSIAFNVQAIKNQIECVDFKNIAGSASAAATNAGAAATVGKTLACALGTPPQGTTIADTVQAMNGQLAKVDLNDIANKASTAATNAIAAATTGQTVASVLGTLPQGTTIADTLTTLATKIDITALQEEIGKLRSLLCHCWWQDACWVYLDRDATDSPAGKVFDQLEFGDETRRGQITAEDFTRACEQHQMQDYLPADPDKLLHQLKRFTAKPSGNP